jgi:hypothetical protein
MRTEFDKKAPCRQVSPQGPKGESDYYNERGRGYGCPGSGLMTNGLSTGARRALGYLAILVAAECLFGSGLWLNLRMGLFDMADTILQGRAADLERYLEAHKEASTIQLQADVGERYKIEHSEDFLEIGLGASSIYRSQFLLQHPLPAISLADSDRPLYRNLKLGNRRFRAVSEQIDVDGRVFLVRIAKPMDEESEMLASVRRYLLWTGSFLFLIAYAIGYRLSHRVMAGRKIL